MQAIRQSACVILFVAALGFAPAGPGAVEGATAGPEGEAIEKNYGGFATPQLGRSRFLGWVRRSLTDRILGEETLFKQYLDEWGLQFETLTINGVLFAYNLDVDGRYPYDITLLDTDCDGVFETKVEEKPGQHVDLPIPECVFGPVPAQNR